MQETRRERFEARLRYLACLSPISPLHLFYTAPTSPPYLPCISAAVRVNQSTERVNGCVNARTVRVNGSKTKCVNDVRQRGESSVNEARERSA